MVRLIPVPLVIVLNCNVLFIVLENTLAPVPKLLPSTLLATPFVPEYCDPETKIVFPDIPVGRLVPIKCRTPLW